MKRAGSTDTEAMISAFRGLTLTIPFGEIEYRAVDHQSTMGAFVGKLGLKDGRAVMIDPVYRKGEQYLPSEAEVSKLRTAVQ